MVVPKVILQSITKPTRAFLRSIVLKDRLWHTAAGVLWGKGVGIRVKFKLYRRVRGQSTVTFEGKN